MVLSPPHAKREASDMADETPDYSRRGLYRPDAVKRRASISWPVVTESLKIINRNLCGLGIDGITR